MIDLNSFIFGYLSFIVGAFLFIIFLWLFIFLVGFIISEVFSFAYSRLTDKGIFFTFVEYKPEYDKKAMRHSKKKESNFDN